MLYKYIIRGCECWLTRETGDAIMERLEEQEYKRKMHDALERAYATAKATDDPMAWSFYSDLFKDCFGVRPH